jgi:hypothetical protein
VTFVGGGMVDPVWGGIFWFMSGWYWQGAVPNGGGNLSGHCLREVVPGRGCTLAWKYLVGVLLGGGITWR